MKKNWMIYLVIPSIIFLAGCDALKNMALGKPPFEKKTAAPAPEKSFEYIQSPELAKVILKPQRKPLTISRDPFKPLITKEMVNQNQEDMDKKLSSLTTLQDTLDDVILIGVVKFENQFRAYLKTDSKTGIYKPRDKVRNYVIQEINYDRIVFKFGNNEIIKKREAK